MRHAWHLFVQSPPHFILSKLNDLARVSGLIQRHSHKFSAEGFLFALIQCATRGTSSFQHLATSQAGFESRSMTRQGISERLNPRSSEFLVRVMNDLFCKEKKSSSDALFQRILIEESTVISMAKSNAEHFLNIGNGKIETAGSKINLVTDWITGHPVSEDWIDPNQIYKLYSIRWSIEIQFRTMKQSNQLHHSLSHRTDPFLIEALVLAVLIRQLLTIDLQAQLNDSLPHGRRVSIEKFSDAYSQYFLTRTLQNLDEPFRYDLRHLIHEKRKRLSLYAATAQPLA